MTADASNPAPRTLIVTGGTGGLGTEVVANLLREHRVAVLYQDESGLAALREATGRPDRLIGVRADVTREASVRAAMDEAAERAGAPYGVVHLAGGFATGSVRETSLETWERMLALNATSAFLVVREGLRVLPSRGPGRMVLIGARATLAPPSGMAAYIVSKTALGALVTQAAADARGSGVTVNALLPDAMDTPANRKAMPGARLVPLKAASAVIEWLLSDAASEVSGALIPVGA